MRLQVKGFNFHEGFFIASACCMYTALACPNSSSARGGSRQERSQCELVSYRKNLISRVSCESPRTFGYMWQRSCTSRSCERKTAFLSALLWRKTLLSISRICFSLPLRRKHGQCVLCLQTWTFSHRSLQELEAKTSFTISGPRGISTCQKTA